MQKNATVTISITLNTSKSSERSSKVSIKVTMTFSMITKVSRISKPRLTQSSLFPICIILKILFLILKNYLIARCTTEHAGILSSAPSSVTVALNFLVLTFSGASKVL